MKNKAYILIAFIGLVLGCFVLYNTYQRAHSPQAVVGASVTDNAAYEKVIFSGGCFWCTESEFNHLPGVVSAVSGFASSPVKNPSYMDVSSEKIKAREAVEVYYDPTVVSFNELLLTYWKHINPIDDGGQFADRGYQYTTAIYYTTEAQKAAAIKSKQIIDMSHKFSLPVVTLVTPLDTFYPAEEYHQDYKDKNPVRYAAYREGSGRNAFIRKNWEDKSTITESIAKAILTTTTSTTTITTKPMTTNTKPWTNFTQAMKEEKLKTLTPLQFNVTQKEGTEPSFQNEYESNKEKGIYVDIVSGEPLFLSQDKYDSGTGWPSFVKPVSDDGVTLHEDSGFFSTRTEVRSKIADSHLGHVFPDGPADRGGKRYCMNSAALRFIKLSDIEKEGYGEYVSLVK